MFENQSPQSSEPPPNLPFQPDDMLANVEKDPSPQVSTPPDALDAGVLKKKSSSVSTTPLYTPPASGPAVSYSVKKPMLGKILTVVIVLVIVAGVSFGGWWLYEKYLKTIIFGEKAPVASGVPPVSRELPLTPPPPSTSVSSDIKNDTILFGELTDSDKDNLDDKRERELGTDATKHDSDNDDLNDGDEVLIWRTDPLKPDTDDDGYKDGDEIKNGYNPIGPGRLLENSAASAITTTPATTTPVPASL